MSLLTFSIVIGTVRGPRMACRVIKIGSTSPRTSAMHIPPAERHKTSKMDRRKTMAAPITRNTVSCTLHTAPSPYGARHNSARRQPAGCEGDGTPRRTRDHPPEPSKPAIAPKREAERDRGNRGSRGLSRCGEDKGGGYRKSTATPVAGGKRGGRGSYGSTKA